MKAKFLFFLSLVVLSHSFSAFGQNDSAPNSDSQQAAAIAQFDKGQTAHERGNLKEALNFYEQAIRLQPEFPEAEFQRGTAFQQLGQTKEAEQAFRRAIVLRREWSLPWAKLGALLVRKQNFQTDSKEITATIAEADAALSKAIELDAENFPAYVALVELRLRTSAPAPALGKLLSQIKNLTDGKQNVPAELWAARAAVERTLGDLKAAQQSAARALLINPKNASARLENAELALSAKDFASAVDNVQVVLNVAPQDLTARILLARILAESKKTSEALKVLDELEPDQKNLTIVQNLRSKIASAQTSETSDTAELEKALATNDKNVVILGQLCALTRRANPAKSLDYCRRAAELEPNNISHAVGYGAALVQARQFAAAIPLLQRILQVAPDNYAARANLATAFYENKQFSQALSEYRFLIQSQPKSAIPYYFIATALDQLGEYPDAMNAYQKFLTLADAKQNQLEIDKVKLRLPTLTRQIEKGTSGKTINKKKSRT